MSLSSQARVEHARFLLALPLLLWLLFLLLAPLLVVASYAFLQRGPYGGVVFELSLENFFRIFDPLYAEIYLQSIVFAASAAVICLMVGLPMAFLLTRVSNRWSQILLAAIVLPFLSNFVVRAYAIKVLLSQEGPISALFVALTGQSLVLTDSAIAVWFGMISNYLPFMVLPLYATMLRFDFTLLEAAVDLGASEGTAFWRVLIPATRAGIVSGFMLVFVPTLGEFMIPDLLGGARTMLLGNLIADQFLKARDWPFGAALVLTLILTLLIGIGLQRRLSKV